MYELHTWGPINDDIPSFSPECMAVAWYLDLALDSNQFVIIPSSNTTIASNGQLPALKHDGQVYGGFFSIIRYLKLLGVVISEQNETNNSEVLALTNYISTNVSTLTLYMMYVHRQNFESITRPLFTQLVPFPMQYNLPLHQRDLAKRQCTHQGLIGNSTTTTSSQVKYPNSLSKLQEQIEEKNKQRQALFDDAKENLRALASAQKIYQTIIEFNPNSSAPFLFGSEITIADLLLLAHLQIQTSEIFPVPVMRTLVESQFPQLFEYLNRGLSQLHPLQRLWNVVPPQGREIYSLSNSLLHLIGA